MLIFIGISVGLISVSFGVICVMECKGVCLSVFKFIVQLCIGGDVFDQIMIIVCVNFFIMMVVELLKMSYVEGLFFSNQKDVLMEEIVVNYYVNIKDVEVVLVEGLVLICKYQFVQFLNYEIVKMLNVEIVFVMFQGIDILEQLKECIELICNSFGGVKNINIIGVIVNKLNVLVDEQGCICLDLFEIFDDFFKVKVNNVDLVKL